MEEGHLGGWIRGQKTIQLEGFQPPRKFPWFGSVDEVLGTGFQSQGGEHFRALAPNLAWKKQSLRRLETAFVSVASCEVSETDEILEPRLSKKIGPL